MNNIKYKTLLNEICAEDCKNNDCLLKEFLISAHPSPRLLIQLKCVERYKKLVENIDCITLTWSEAMDAWVKNGRAKRFAEVYTEDKKYLQIYKEVMEKENEV